MKRRVPADLALLLMLAGCDGSPPGAASRQSRAPGGRAGWRPRRLPVLRFGRGAVEVRDGGHGRDLDSLSFVLCGARAGFLEMERLPLSGAEAMRLMGAESFDTALAQWGQY